MRDIKFLNNKYMGITLDRHLAYPKNVLENIPPEIKTKNSIIQKLTSC